MTEATSSPAVRRARSANFHAWAWSTAGGVVALGSDLAGTAWAQRRLRPGDRSGHLMGWARFRLAGNNGAAHGLGSSHEMILAVVQAVGLVALVVLTARTQTRASRIGFGLAIGGGLGNLVERIVQPPGILKGPVVDWIHLNFYPPTFNLADMWLRSGLILAVAAGLLNRHRAVGRRRMGNRVEGGGAPRTDTMGAGR